MSLLKYIRRFEYMHWLIKTGNSGSCDEFAVKLGLSRRQLLDNLKDFKELGAPIKYSKVDGNYYYCCTWEPFLDFPVDRIEC